MTSNLWKMRKKKAQNIIDNLIRYLQIASTKLDKNKMSIVKPAMSSITITDDRLSGESDISYSFSIENSISKIEELAKYIEKKYDLPPDGIFEEREIFNYYFPERDASQCPKCNHKFGKQLSRAKYCPSCNEYLSVRYGHLVTKDELDDIFKKRQAIAVVRFGVPNRIDEIRMMSKYGCDDSIKRVITKLSEQLAELI